MATSEHTLSRRQALAGLSVLGAVAIPTVASTKTTIARPDRRAWDSAMAHLKRCEAAFNRSDEGYDAFLQAYERARPSKDIIDWREFSCMDRDYVARVMSIDEYERERLASEGRLWWAKNPEACRARIRAAFDSVREFRRLEMEAGERTGYRAYDEKHEAISDRHYNALTALVEMPAPDSEALLWKINHLFTEANVDWSEEYTAQFFTDARRLLSNGRA